MEEEAKGDAVIMNKEKRKALIILTLFVFWIIGVPFLIVITFKPCLTTIVNLFGSIFFMGFGALSLYIVWDWKIKKVNKK